MLLKTPLFEKLQQLKLKGIVQALQLQIESNQYSELCFEDRLGMLVDRELDDRNTKQLHARLKNAHIDKDACIANMDFKQNRNLDKQLILDLSQNHWIKHHQNLIITGATGSGKSFLASSLCHHACLDGYKVYFVRAHRLFEELALARALGSYHKQMKVLNKNDIIILDDFGISNLDEFARRDLLEILEDRYNKKSTIVTSQYPITSWHDKIGDPTLADAILDRLVHNAFKINLNTKDSLRKIKSSLSKSDI